MPNQGKTVTPAQYNLIDFILTTDVELIYADLRLAIDNSLISFTPTHVDDRCPEPPPVPVLESWYRLLNLTDYIHHMAIEAAKKSEPA